MIDKVIEHLQQKTTDYKSVKHAWTMEPVEDIQDEAPLLMLLPGPVSAPQDDYDNTVIQEATSQIICLTVCPHDQLDCVRQQLLDNLLGVQLTPQHTMMRYVAGSVMDITGKHIWWKDTFSTSVHYRSK